MNYLKKMWCVAFVSIEGGRAEFKDFDSEKALNEFIDGYEGATCSVALDWPTLNEKTTLIYNIGLCEVQARNSYNKLLNNSSEGGGPIILDDPEMAKTALRLSLYKYAVKKLYDRLDQVTDNDDGDNFTIVGNS